MGCVDSTPVQQTRTPSGRSRSAVRPYRVTKRLETSTKKEEIVMFTDEEKHKFQDSLEIYTCPICTNHFNKILSCSECSNCVCLTCFLTYDEKTKNNFKCYFCGSYTSKFRDYYGQAHLYFDNTGTNFVSKDEKDKIDEELRMSSLKTMTGSKAPSERANEEVLVQ